MPERPEAAITTLLFTDLVNSTELIQQVGDEQAQRIFEDALPAIVHAPGWAQNYTAMIHLASRGGSAGPRRSWVERHRRHELLRLSA
jgi:hypothetical protein